MEVVSFFNNAEDAREKGGGKLNSSFSIASSALKIILVTFYSLVCSDLFAQQTFTPIPQGLSDKHIMSQSQGCLDCHLNIDQPSMHHNPAVKIGCADCHGGDPKIRSENMQVNSEAYNAAKLAAHIAPSDPKTWKSSANPENSYAKLLKEPYEFVKFINPGDLRVARETCGGCHAQTVHAVERSLMTTSAMLLEGAAYNNGILPFKTGVLGESVDANGIAREIHDPYITEDDKKRGALSKLIPFPQWEVISPGDIFRVFERGGRLIRSQFAEVGLPNPEEEPGRPDIKASNRGPGTGARISVPILNIHKTRLNDPHLTMLGTNDHPGDYRSSGCTGCHSIYANDRDPRHSGPYAKFGNEGKSQTSDTSIPRDESGHPLKHEFTRAIPTSQCMVCHMHQPNMFVNSFLGYTMWDYESDAPHMWPEKQKYNTIEEEYKIREHNPEGAAVRGKWGDKEFLKNVTDLNKYLRDTQFADYHGHGWNFRAIYKRDRKGNLLDEKGQKVDFNDPEKFRKAVHMADIHVDKGMHCVDCHFNQDAHGDGHMYTEVAQAVEVQCEDCHGTINQYANLTTSGPAAKGKGQDLTLKRTPYGEPLFEWIGKDLYQHSYVTEGLKWKVSQVKDSVDPASPEYNEKSARSKTLRKLESGQKEASWGLDSEGHAPSAEQLAHSNDKMTCFTCHSSWVTSCAGCHLPIEANWKADSKHYDGKQTRNWATYNPQVARDEMFQLGKHGPAKDGKISPIRSSSALVLSSTDVNRQKIYIQQPPISSPGYSSQAFAPHFPHTVRKTETKGCEDCHVSEKDNNNAIMAQLLLLGTNFVNFMGYNVWTATGEAGLDAVQVTEWEEPQAVLGSYLHKYAYPDFYKQHQERKMELKEVHTHHGAGGITNTIQLRGEYVFTTGGSDGFRIYDAASVSNKGFSERIVTGPVSPLGHDTHIPSKNATSFALPTTMPVSAARKQLPENMETPVHEIHHYAFIADSEEGLILTNIDTMADGDPSNNFLSRALTWNEDNILRGASYITLAGTRAFITTPEQLVILDLDIPLEPKVISTVSFNKARSVVIQFRYALVADLDGLHVLDITEIGMPKKVAAVKIADARSVYIARTYAYVAAGKEGLIIVDIEKPTEPFIYSRYDEQGTINDLNDVKVATTNASLFAYLADGKNGLKVLQLTDPERVPEFYGFSPEVKPKLIAWAKTTGPALAISKPLDRDRAVDETGHQVSIFGRIGSRPFNLEEMQHFYKNSDGELYKVRN